MLSVRTRTTWISWLNSWRERKCVQACSDWGLRIFCSSHMRYLKSTYRCGYMRREEKIQKTSYCLLALPCQRIISIKLSNSKSKAWLVNKKKKPMQIHNIYGLLFIPGCPWAPVIFGKCPYSCCVMIILLIWRKDNHCLSQSLVTVILVSLFRSCAKQKGRTAISSSQTVPSKRGSSGKGHSVSGYFRTNYLSSKFIMEQILVHSEIKIFCPCGVSTLQFGPQWSKYVSQ